MPPKGARKTSATRSSQNTQGTLAFGAQNKITKSSTAGAAATSTGKKQLSKPAIATVVDAVVEPSPVPESIQNDPSTSDSPPPPSLQPASPSQKSSNNQPLPLRKSQPKASTPPSSSTKTPITKPTTTNLPAPDPHETLALSLPTKAITQYWHHKESTRLHPRIHQQTLSLHEKILREFDLSSQYGPCIGIARMKRWKRAEGLGLKPPIEVLAVLVREREREGAERKSGGGGGGKGGGGEGGGGGGREYDRAAMEGLLSSRLAEG